MRHAVYACCHATSLLDAAAYAMFALLCAARAYCYRYGALMPRLPCYATLRDAATSAICLFTSRHIRAIT